MTKSIESSFCDYSDVYILVTGDIAAADARPQRKQALNADTQVAFKNYAPFKDCRKKSMTKITTFIKRRLSTIL